MENRFTIKDFFLFALVVVAICMVGLSMKQFDRQFKSVESIEKQNRTLTNDLTAIRDQLKNVEQQLRAGVAVNPNANSGGAPPVIAVDPQLDPKTDPFRLVRAAKQKPGFAYGDWLVDMLPARIGRLTPLVNEDVYGSAVRARVGETLVTRDPESLERRPLLAESYEFSKDGLELRYKLRKDVLFSDGTPFSADDVIFTFDHILNPEIDAARARSYLTEQGVSWEKLNDHEVMFRMKRPYFEFLNITGDQLILSKAFYSKIKSSDYNEKPGLLFGTGPYRLRNPGGWTPGERIELVRNDRYWGVKPAFERIVYLEVEEEAVQTTMYQNGEIDSISCTPEQFDRLKVDPKTIDKSNPYDYPSMLGGYTYVGWNQERGGKKTYFADKRVRQALTMLIDRERMAKELWRGYANVAAGPFTQRGQQAAPDVKPWPYDPERAKKQLADAGFVDKDNDGILNGPDGNPFQFTLVYNSKSDISQRIALFLKDSLARAGIEMTLKPTDWPTMLEVLKRSDFDACTLGWSASVESDLFQIFHSSQTKDNGDNRTAYANPDLDKLIDQARSTVDDEARMKLWQAAARILHEDQPYTFLLERLSLRFYDKRIHNIEKTRMGLNLMNTEVMPIPWFSAQGQHKYTN